MVREIRLGGGASELTSVGRRSAIPISPMGPFPFPFQDEVSLTFAASAADSDNPIQTTKRAASPRRARSHVLARTRSGLPLEVAVFPVNNRMRMAPLAYAPRQL